MVVTSSRPVRVSDEAHAILARLAGQRQQSVSGLIDVLARQADWEEMARSERAARRAEKADPAMALEYSQWDVATGDGLG